MEYQSTKAERREKKKRNRRKMVVTGRGVKLILRLIIDRAKKGGTK